MKSVLMLSSATCVPCKSLKPVVIEVCDSLGIELSIKTISGASDPLVQKYNVRSVPVVFLLEDGEVVKSFTGVRSKEEVEEFLK